jgi:FRG domain
MATRDRSAELHETMRSERIRTPLRIEDRTLPTIDHPLFGRVWTPQTMVELGSLLSLFGWQLRGGWRGQADIDWFLDSTAVRRLQQPLKFIGIRRRMPTDLEARVRDYERRLLDAARLSGHGRADGRDLYDLELLALLRHHGAATRLLDFTRNVWVALWFACRESPDSLGLLVGLDISSAYEVSDLDTLACRLPDLLDRAGPRLSLWRPSALSPRMPAQQSFFLWGAAEPRPWGSIGRDLFEAGQIPLVKVEPLTSRGAPDLACVAVPPELKRDLGLHWRSLFGYEHDVPRP